MTILLGFLCCYLSLISVYSIGDVSVSEIRHKKIVNGISTSATNYPFIASLIQHNSKSGTSSYSFCGGSLLRKSYPAVIITAAHCLVNIRGALQVDLHRSDIDAPYSLANNYARYNSLGYVIHNNYDDTTVDNDVALIFLDTDLSEHSHLVTVDIPDLSNYTLECCTSNDELKVIGYGSVFEGGPVTDTLQYSDKRFVNRNDCNRLLTKYTINTYYDGAIEYTHKTGWVWDWATNNMICAMGDNTDSCQGDSGGPLVKSGTNEQVGIVSWGFGCNNDVPGVYTNVGLYHSWILDQLETYNGNSSIPPNSPISSVLSIFSDVRVSLWFGLLNALLFV